MNFDIFILAGGKQLILTFLLARNHAKAVTLDGALAF